MPGESHSSRGVKSGLQAHRKDKHPPDTAGPTNIRDNPMVKGKHRNVTDSNKGNMAPSEPNSLTTASSENPNTMEKQDFYLKSQLMMLIEGFKKDVNISFKEIQENTGKLVEALKELQESTTKQVKELNKTIRDLKREVETIKKSQREAT